MKSRYLKAGLLMLGMVLSLSMSMGCGKVHKSGKVESVSNTELTDAIENTSEDDNISQVQGDLANEKEVWSETKSDENNIASEASDETAQMLEEIYLQAVADIVNQKSFPNGKTIDAPSDGGGNYYAITDIDQDGHAELLISYANANTMAGCVFYIFDYNFEKEKFYEEITEYPDVTIFDNGIIKAEASHNHGRSNLDDFWPYNLYSYNQEEDVYECIANVDAWQKVISEGMEPDKDFPVESDLDDDGVVYYLADFDTSYEPFTIMDNAEYDAWFKEKLKGAEEVHPNFEVIAGNIGNDMRNDTSDLCFDGDETYQMIPDQCFTFEFTPFGKATFESYEPDDVKGNRDAWFKVKKDGSIVSVLNDPQNIAATLDYGSIDAVSFPDLNTDGYDDVIVLMTYAVLGGPDAGSEVNSVRIFIGSETGEFMEDTDYEIAVMGAVEEWSVAAVKKAAVQYINMLE